MRLLERGFRGAALPERPPDDVAESTQAASGLGRYLDGLSSTHGGRHTGVVIEASDVRRDEGREHLEDSIAAEHGVTVDSAVADSHFPFAPLGGAHILACVPSAAREND
jgi:hypothetical protein